MTQSAQSISEDFEKNLKTLDGKVLETYTNQKFKINIRSKTVEVTPLSTGKLRSIGKETILKAYNYLRQDDVIEGVGRGEKSIRSLGFSETNPAYFWAILKNFDDIETENKKLKYKKSATDSIPIHPEVKETNDENGESINDDTKILVNITSSKGFKVGLWEKLDVKIQNVSEDILKDIKIELFGPVETNGNKIIPILKGKGGQTDIVIGLKPKEPGEVPIRFEVVFFNQKGDHFKVKKEAFISVARESETISSGQLPVINIGHIDRSTNLNGNVIQRSNIGVGARKCPNCSREVEVNEKFCNECGARL